MESFTLLGETIERRWQAENYNEENFSLIAAQALVESDLPKKVAPDEVLRWLHTQYQLPAQLDIDSKFGDLPITLDRRPRFCVDIYFWLDGTTQIHQHSFSGALQVLSGSSLHSRFNFHQEQKVNEHFALGQIKLEQIELLSKGAVREIKSGRQFAHALFHLDRPSVSIAVRTYQTPSASPQFSYEKPYIAIDPFFKEESTIRKLQSVDMLLRMGHPQAETLIGGLLERSDLHTAYLLLRNISRHLHQNLVVQSFGVNLYVRQFEKFLSIARQKHGTAIAAKFSEVFDEHQRIAEIVDRRGVVKDGEHRFFLALLLNVSGVANIFRVVRERFPSASPEEKVLGWISDLSKIRNRNTNGANVLGLDDFDNMYLIISKGLLSGWDDEKIEVEMTKNAAPSHLDSVLKDVRVRCARLRQSNLLKSLFTK